MSDITIEIHLSLATPEQVILDIEALVVDSPTIAETPIDQPGEVLWILRPGAVGSFLTSGYVHPRLVPSIQLTTVPSIEIKTGRHFGLRTFLILSGIIYHVTGAAVYTVQLIEKQQPHIQETKINGSVVPIDEVKKTIKNEERPQTTPSATSSGGD